MLSQLTIRNYAIVEALDLELQGGMTVVSGETGAGKSIMLDALALALGARAESGTVRAGAERAEVTAAFNLSTIPEAQHWLQKNELEQEGDCYLRRVITREGRSRCYINGRPSPIAAVRELGQFLVDIHGQHEHQRLLKKEHHRSLLDAFAGADDLASEVSAQYRRWRKLATELHRLTEQSEEQTARVQLLGYQLEELEQLALAEGELEDLEQAQKLLASAGEIQHTGYRLLQLSCDGEEDNCLQRLHQCQQLLAQLNNDAPALAQVAEMLSTAQIQIEEAGHEMRHFLNGVELNPERQQEVEERLSAIYDIARKHRLLPEQLPAFQQALREELHGLSRSDEELAQLEVEVRRARQAYLASAGQLTGKRTAAADRLNTAVDQQLHALGMTAASFKVALQPMAEAQLGATGQEEVEFLISTNKGQPAKPLAKIASGGELSRISLAIQVITAQSASTPTLVFDEVDVGIGGAIAEVVGRLLRALGERSQILCVTHQPQVASQGHQHLFVSKKASRDNTNTRIDQLDDERRIHEVARMLGGIDITTRSIEHAREMLGMA